jgi:membrane-associated protein
MTFNELFSIVTHIEQHLAWIATYNALSYGILTSIVFLETALVLCAWLPGDSLLFAAGTVAGLGHLNIHYLMTSLTVAAVFGNLLNYWLGYQFGKRYLDYLLSSKYNRIIKPEHILKTKDFFTRFGVLTLLMSPFLPFVRTFAPFLAGLANMRFATFALYSMLGAVGWIGLFLYSSFYLGHIPIVRDNFIWFTLLIVSFSVALPVISMLRHRLQKVV